jgi:hypothetical protein
VLGGVCGMRRRKAGSEMRQRQGLQTTAARTRHSGSSGGRRRKISVRRCPTSSVAGDPVGASVGIVALVGGGKDFVWVRKRAWTRMRCE